MELRPPYFCAAVARTDNFTRAAAACHGSQPSLSQQIIKLEDEVGAGKTTTLATLVSELNEQREDHIITVEDPIEVVQTPKGRSAGHEILLQHEALPNTIRSGQIANIRGIIESSANDGMITDESRIGKKPIYSVPTSELGPSNFIRSLKAHIEAHYPLKSR